MRLAPVWAVNSCRYWSTESLSLMAAPQPSHEPSFSKSAAVSTQVALRPVDQSAL